MIKNYFFALLLSLSACCKGMEHNTGQLHQKLPRIKDHFSDLFPQLPSLNSEAPDILPQGAYQLLSLAYRNSLEQNTDSMEEDTEQPDQTVPSLRELFPDLFTIGEEYPQHPPLNSETQDILAHRTYLAPYVEASYNYSLEETPNYQVQTPQVNEIPSPKEQLTIIQYNTPQSPQKFYCALGCGVFSLWRTSIKTHELAHTDGKRVHTCDAPNCHATFTNKAQLSTHKRMHNPTVLCRVQGCNRAFARTDNRARHEARHLQKKSFKCERCGAGFIEKSDYNRHNEQLHEKNHFQCIKCCKKLFNSFGRLQQHYNKKVRKGVLEKCAGKIIVAENV